MNSDLTLSVADSPVLPPITFQIFGESGLPLGISIPGDQQSPTPIPLVIVMGTIPNYPNLSLYSPMTVKIGEDEDGYVASVVSIPMRGFGKTAGAAVGDFLELLGGTFVGIKNAPDHGLTKDAVKLREHLELLFLPQITCDAQSS